MNLISLTLDIALSGVLGLRSSSCWLLVMTTVLSSGCEVSDKSIKSLNNVLCCSVRQALYHLAAYFNAIIRFHKTRSL